MSSWFFVGGTTPAYQDTKHSTRIGEIAMAKRVLGCQLCDFLLKLASDAAQLAGLPGAASSGMYSLHVSRFSHAFLNTTRRTWSLEDGPAVFYVAPLFSSGSKARDWALQNNSCFMPLSTGSRGTFARKLLPKADLDVVRQWVQHCNRCHTHEDCNASGKPQFDAEFSVIDCETRELVLLPACSPYVTLSYVWGTETAPADGHHGRLPESLSRLIEDAILVTASLGYRFLWIDRYCISASNKATSIRNMDRIYSESTLTIIASASEEPSQGLIGLGSDRTRLPHALLLEGLGLSQVSTGLAREVQSSKWNTRAWTYQESFLSNRRIVFTQSQCYFECGEMWCTEGLHIPLENLEGLGNEQFRIDRVFPWVADKYSPVLSGTCNRREQSEAYFVERVREYMRRELTYQADAFDAFAGVLNYLEQFASEFLLGNISGLPIWTRGSRWSTAGCGQEILLYCLTWSISRSCEDGSGNMAQVGWHLNPSVNRSFRSFLANNAAERRHEFPSWTWCGWKLPTPSSGKIGWRTIPTMDSVSVPVELSIEYEGGHVLRWPKLSDAAVLLASKDEEKTASYICAKGMLSKLVIPANCWYENYDGECQCGPYRMKRRDVQYLSSVAGQRNFDSTERGYVLTAWFCHALDFGTGEDNCRTEVMILVPTSEPDTYERLDAMCQIKMEYFVTRPSVEAMALRFEWELVDFRIG
ncbi:unnamed protein product [Discula destructiva]